MNSALRRYGAETHVLTSGYDPQGREVFAVVHPLGSSQYIRHLVHTDTDFINDLFPPYAQRLREIRNTNTLRIAKALTSPLMIKISAIALVVLVLGFYFG
ncbi:hypothetical protein R50073_09300 [Maricurvus nonylphenolicus]